MVLGARVNYFLMINRIAIATQKQSAGHMPKNRSVRIFIAVSSRIMAFSSFIFTLL
jgi:hypothetical protein